MTCRSSSYGKKRQFISKLRIPNRIEASLLAASGTTRRADSPIGVLRPRKPFRKLFFPACFALFLTSFILQLDRNQVTALQGRKVSPFRTYLLIQFIG